MKSVLPSKCQRSGMHLHFETNTSSRTECTIHSLSWMGKVPDSLPGETTSGGWKLNRSQYYSEGWLASGNAKGIVGATFTASHCRKYDPPNRSNFNLRGHRSEVGLFDLFQLLELIVKASWALVHVSVLVSICLVPLISF